MTLAEVFEQFGISRQLLVEKIGMKRQYASMLWHNQRRLGAHLGHKISKEFNVPLQPLLFPEEYTTDTLPPLER